MSACESNSPGGLLLATEAWATVTWIVLRDLMNLSFSLLGWLSTFDGSYNQVFTWVCLIPLSFLSRAGLFLSSALGLSSGNKLSLLLLSVFAFCMITLVSEALPLYKVFLPFMSTAFFDSSYIYWHCAIDIESCSSLEYFFHSIFSLKVSCLVQFFLFFHVWSD